jgi:8-oxo-(d)GTP phosphatase
MKIFIHDIPVNIFSKHDLLEMELYDQVIDNKKTKVKPEFLSGHTLIENATLQQSDEIMKYLRENGHASLKSITLSVKDYNVSVDHVKRLFTIVKAAGGLVLKDRKALFIYRLKRWDLPKGKLDNGESTKMGAVREVEEECNIKVRLEEKICTTWHTYKSNGKPILKKTSWYTMVCIDDSKMKPQIEENIEDIRWFEYDQLKQVLADTYPSIAYVLHKYFHMHHNL